MKNYSRSTLYIFILGILSLQSIPTICHADGNAESKPRSRVAIPIAKTASEESTGQRFDFLFDGGTPQELIEALSEASDGPVNAIIPEKADFFRMPRLDLKDVTLREVLSQLTWFSEIPVPEHDEPNRYSYFTAKYRWQLSNGVWTFRMEIPPEPLPRSFEVEPANMKRHLEVFSIEDISTAIDSAWKLAGASEGAKLLFHPETEILLIHGTQSDIRMAKKVLDTLDHTDVTLPQRPRLISVSILGQVNKAGAYDLDPGSTLIDALSHAGGETRLAALSRVIVSRRGDTKLEKIGVNLTEIINGNQPEFKLQDGDIITFTERRF